MFSSNNSSNRQHHRRAVAAVFTLVLMGVLIGCAALTVDTGMIRHAQTELQDAADAASLAAANAFFMRVCDYEDDRAWYGDACHAILYEVSSDIAKANYNYGLILPRDGLVAGHWNKEADVFIPWGAPTNAFRAVTRRTSENGNPVPLAFAAIWGIHNADVSATATSVAFVPTLPGGGARFLLDEDMFDTDIPVIEDLAASLGLSPDDMLSDRDGDGFIDIPPGEVLELPTGQEDDAAIFEIMDNFQFTPDSTPSLEDFLRYNKDGRKYGIRDSDLDPLVGVTRTNNSSKYASFVNPVAVLVSPLYKSDVNHLGPDTAEAKGERRGLVAYKIIGVGADPDGNGSVLPNLIIEIVDPSLIDLSEVGFGYSGVSGIAANLKPQLVM